MTVFVLCGTAGGIKFDFDTDPDSDFDLDKQTKNVPPWLNPFLDNSGLAYKEKAPVQLFNMRPEGDKNGHMEGDL